MTILNFLKKNWFILFTVTILYFSYVTLAIKPSNLKYFSLTDDGQVLMQNGYFLKNCIHNLSCNKFFDQAIELGTNRYRPTYWVAQAVVHYFIGNNAVYFHLFRVYFIGYLQVILLVLLLINLSIDSTLIYIASIVFFTNYSFSENIIRLGPNEPYQVIALAIFSLIYINIKDLLKLSRLKYLFLLIFLALTVLIKETNVAILPTVFFLELYKRKRNVLNRRVLFIVMLPIFLLLAMYVIKESIPTTVSNNFPVYTSNYTSNIPTIISNSMVVIGSLFDSMLPYLKITILASFFVFYIRHQRSILLKPKYVYWYLFSIFFVGIMFPWKYLLERYLLIGIFGLTVTIAIILNALKTFVVSKLHQYLVSKTRYFIFNTFMFIVLTNLFFRGFPVNLAKTINYSNWYSLFTKFEAEQVDLIAKYNSMGVSINGVDNINDWEFFYELPIHLKYLYTIDSNIDLYNALKPSKNYVFTRSSFDKAVSDSEFVKTDIKLVESQTYSVPQIDPLDFRDKFSIKPIGTLLTPPFKENGFSYTWSLYKINK